MKEKCLWSCRIVCFSLYSFKKFAPKAPWWWYLPRIRIFEKGNIVMFTIFWLYGIEFDFTKEKYLNPTEEFEKRYKQEVQTSL